MLGKTKTSYVTYVTYIASGVKTSILSIALKTLLWRDIHNSQQIEEFESEDLLSILLGLYVRFGYKY